jgi:hypothetical protein
MTNVCGTEAPRSTVEKIKMRVVTKIVNQFIFSLTFHPASSNMSHRMQCTKVALYSPYRIDCTNVAAIISIF